MNKKFIISIVVVACIVTLSVYFFNELGSRQSEKKNSENILTTMDTIIESSSTDSYTTGEETKLVDSGVIENAITPLFIKSVYLKDNKWWADVDYVTAITPFEHMKRRILDKSCVIPGMTESEMIEYAKNSLLKYVERDNLIVLNCGYDPQGIWYSDGVVPRMFINQNPLIRSIPFADNFNSLEKHNEVCGGNNVGLPSSIKQTVEVESEGIPVNRYSYDIYNTRGYFEDMVVIKDGEIKKFDGHPSCPG